MKVALLIADGGDGYANIQYFKDVEFARKLADSDKHCDTFNINEGMDIIDVPDDFYPPGGFSDGNWEDDEEDYDEE